MANETLPPEEEMLEGEGEGEVEPQGAISWLMSMPYWAISAVVHVVLLLVLGTIVWKEQKAEEKEVVVRLALPPVAAAKPPPYDPTLRRDVKKTPKLASKDENTPMVIKKEVEEITPDIPLGTSMDNLTNKAVTELNPAGINDAIGVGGGGAAAYGERWGRGSLKNEGGEGTEDAVRAALEWLKRHQSPDGSWKSRDFTENCKKTCTCVDSRYGDGRGFAGHDVGVTGLAILAFAGFAHTHLHGQHPDFVLCVRKAVGYLKSVQVHSTDPTTNGRFGAAEGEQWIYNHSIATMAMAELLVMSRDVIGLKKTVTDAINLCLAAQNPGAGWRYGIRSGQNDTSVTGWMVLALKTAKYAQLDIPKDSFEQAFTGALTWFTRATATSGKTGYQSPGDSGSLLQKIYPEPYPYSKQLSCMTAVGVLCRLFAGEKRTSPAIKSGVEILMKEVPQWLEQRAARLSKINFYYWYYASYAMFQFGGSQWHKWNEAMKEAIIPNQRMGAMPDGVTPVCEDGSWDPVDEWGPAGGRVYTTAICAMTLEVYYRFVREEKAALTR